MLPRTPQGSTRPSMDRRFGDDAALGNVSRGYDAAADAYNDMNFPATVSSFVLDKYEVTVGRFRQFVEAGEGAQGSPPAAGAGAHPRLAGSGWDSAWNTNLAVDTAALKGRVKCDSTHQTWTDAPGVNEKRR
jgi:formylglycine-generating enzyme